MFLERWWRDRWWVSVQWSLSLALAIVVVLNQPSILVVDVVIASSPSLVLVSPVAAFFVAVVITTVFVAANKQQNKQSSMIQNNVSNGFQFQIEWVVKSNLRWMLMRMVMKLMVVIELKRLGGKGLEAEAAESWIAAENWSVADEASKDIAVEEQQEEQCIESWNLGDVELELELVPDCYFVLHCIEHRKDKNHGTFLLILMMGVPYTVKIVVLHRDDDCSSSANKQKTHR